MVLGLSILGWALTPLIDILILKICSILVMIILISVIIYAVNAIYNTIIELMEMS